MFPGEWSVDNTDPANPVILIRGARLPVSKDLLIVNGMVHQLGSLVVQAPIRDAADKSVILEDRYFIPETAIELINSL